MNSPERKDQRVKSEWGDYLITKPGNLRSHHHLLYAALRQRDWKAGFKPLTNKNHLQAHNNEPYASRMEALSSLRHDSGLAETHIKGVKFGGKLSDWAQRSLDETLKPFQGTVTPEMLVKVFEYIQTTI
jgi:hypothetical protein